jgi:hypothetical protein
MAMVGFELPMGAPCSNKYCECYPTSAAELAGVFSGFELIFVLPLREALLRAVVEISDCGQKTSSLGFGDRAGCGGVIPRHSS